MKNILAAIAFLFCLVAGAQDKYPYPMNIPVSLTASFAELRANHFHAGLDMSTQGVIGVEVRSVADGYVSRIKISPFGYGNALYITHPDGHTTLYGHLSAFVGKIDTLARREQYAHKSFEIDAYFKPEQMPIKKGELIALSGNSGSSGGPHLHFEVRDAKTDDAFNPLAYLMPITDTQSPTVYGIKLYGMNDSAQVANRCQDKYYALADIEGKTISAYGEIGVGVRAVDFFIAGHRPCGVPDVKLYDGERLMYHSSLVRVAFDETRYINSFIDFAERKNNDRFIQKSFVEPNNHINYVYNVHEPLIVKAGEIHHMKYVLTDYNGNSRVVNFTINGKKNATAAPRTHRGDRVEWGKTWAKDTLGISVIIPRESFYRDEDIEISNLQLTNDMSIFRVGSEDIAIHKPFTISLPIDEVQKSYGKQLFVGLVDGKSRQTYVGGTVDGNTIVAHPKQMGSFAIGVDTIAPKIVSKNSRSSLKPSNSIMIGISDNMSGIKKYNVYVDGKWECFEYDYKNARLITTVGRINLKPGAHKLEAVVEDACGNVARWSWGFNVVSQ